MLMSLGSTSPIDFQAFLWGGWGGGICVEVLGMRAIHTNMPNQN